MVRDERGAAAIEFALIAPLLFGLLSGIIAYGGWFWTAHEVQQAANEAARAALSGLDAGERRTVATGAANRVFADSGRMDARRARVETIEAAGMVTVRIAYDLRGDPLAGLNLVPLPAQTVRRSATVRLDGP